MIMSTYFTIPFMNLPRSLGSCLRKCGIMADLCLAILSPVIEVLIDRITSCQVLDFFKAGELDDGLLKELKVTLRTVKEVLDDAEEKQFTRPAIKDWLDDLKDAAYEAEDFLDEIAYQTIRLEVEAGHQQTSTRKARLAVRNLFYAFHPCRKKLPSGEMVPKLKRIVDALKLLAEQMVPLGLKGGVGEKPLSHRIPTTSLVDESSVCGRDGDKEDLIKLMQSDDGKGYNLQVILIVGMGGLGKTTLSQLVYNDSRVQEWFELKAWVCVPEAFDVFNVTKDILKGFGFLNCDLMSPDGLHRELERKLTGCKVLLVLDDIWNASQEKWDSLMKPFKNVKEGSRIIITTRDASVGLSTPAVTTYHLLGLTDTECWSLFAKHAFDDGTSAGHPILEKIGKDIVRKCQGLPLAAKTLGGLLQNERRVDQWKKVLKSNFWKQDNSILPALTLSYHYLPSHLKRCFSYCAIFPKDYLFEKKELVLLWMAEGFIVQPQGDEQLEDIGEQYFQDLVSRSFFQQSSSHPWLYIMHDLINELAKFVSRDFCFMMEGDNSFKSTRRTRHLSCPITECQTFENVGGICDHPQFLRTFLVPSSMSSMQHGMDGMDLCNLLLSMERLRVLSLHGSHYMSNFCLFELPDSIGNLKHLRYMNLSGADIWCLPESLCKLYNLQILILYRCNKLIKLPVNMGRLINLQLLDIRKTGLQEMPPHMDKLTRLQKLTDFFVGKQSGSSIKELGKLSNLRGKLHIWNLQNIVDARDAMEANFKGKEHLNKLEFSWDGDTNIELHERVLEQLQPHTELKSLSVHFYGGTRFPKWVGDSSFSHLVSLKLRGCKIFSLPSFGQLASLEELWIKSFDRVKVIGLDFYGRCKSMKHLKDLKFDGMLEWREWISDDGDVFPRLQKLSMMCCPKLVRALPRFLPSITQIELWDCEQLQIECFPLECFPKLEKLYIHSSSKLTSFSKGTLHALSLTDVNLHGCSNLKSLPESMHSLVNLKIVNCEELESSPAEGLPMKLESLSITSCNKFIAGRKHWDMQRLLSLSSFTIHQCNSVESFPEKTLLPSTLTVLSIRDLQNLKYLDYEGLCHLTSLRRLHIWNCPKLQSLPEEGLPLSLSSLSIFECHLLGQRCEREKGEDWHKICNIPDVKVMN